jgi:hypothetical protein
LRRREPRGFVRHSKKLRWWFKLGIDVSRVSAAGIRLAPDPGRTSLVTIAYLGYAQTRSCAQKSGLWADTVIVHMRLWTRARG